MVSPMLFSAPLELAVNPGEKARLAVPEFLLVEKLLRAKPVPLVVENVVRSQETLFWALTY